MEFLHSKNNESHTSFKVWFQNNFHKSSSSYFEGSHYFDPFDSHIKWLGITKILPSKIIEEIHVLCDKAHEDFLRDFFPYAKKIKEIESKIIALQIDIIEHCHLHTSNFDRSMLSEHIDELKKMKHVLYDLSVKEKELYTKISKSLDDKIYKKIQHYLKK